MLLTGSTDSHLLDRSHALQVLNDHENQGLFFPVQSYDLYLPEEQLGEEETILNNIFKSNTTDDNKKCTTGENPSSKDPKDKDLRCVRSNSEQNLKDFEKVRVLLPYLDQSNDFLFADGVLSDDLYTATARDFLETGNESAQIVELLFVKYINNAKDKLYCSHPSAQSSVSKFFAECITIFYVTQKIVIHGPVVTSDVSFGHNRDIFEQTARALLDFFGHCDLECVPEPVPVVERSNIAVRNPTILFSYLYSTYGTNCDSHVAYSVHISPEKLGTNTGTRIHSTPATDSKVSTKDVAIVSTPTDNKFLPRTVSNDHGPSVSSRSVQSMGDLPMYRDSNKDCWFLPYGAT